MKTTVRRGLVVTAAEHPRALLALIVGLPLGGYLAGLWLDWSTRRAHRRATQGAAR